jgi:NADH-quinone oxidoreductase E subunit
MEVKLSDQKLKQLNEILARYPERQAALMPALWLIQEEYGWISVESVQYISALLNIPAEVIYGVLNFYTMYNKKPVGKYHLQVCTNVSCMLRGGYDILKQVEDKLSLKKGETSADMKFTITEVECLGSCGTAPMMQVNDDYAENLTFEKVNEIIDKLSKEN